MENVKTKITFTLASFPAFGLDSTILSEDHAEGLGSSTNSPVLTLSKTSSVCKTHREYGNSPAVQGAAVEFSERGEISSSTSKDPLMDEAGGSNFVLFSFLTAAS